MLQDHDKTSKRPFSLELGFKEKKCFPNVSQNDSWLVSVTDGAVCVSESALRFDSRSYLKYLHGQDEDSWEFKLSLGFKTLHTQGLIMSTHGAGDWGALQVLPPVLLDGNAATNMPRVSFRLNLCFEAG